MDTELLNEEIGALTQRIETMFADAVAALIERRDQVYANETAALETEKDNLAKESAAIEEASTNLEKILPAQARVAQREADELLILGRAKEAKEKTLEAEKAAAAPEAMRQRQQQISLRIEAIAGERRAIARRIFEAWYAECQTVVRAAERGLFSVLLDGLKQSFNEYQERTDTGGTLNRPYDFLVKDHHITNLTADEHSPEWQAGHKFYKGRTR
jgi:hypothetical protein